MIKIESKKNGAELISIKKDDIEMMHDGIEFWQRHAPILFPIVGQLKDGTTIIENKEYKMGQHGFARDMEFSELEKSETLHRYVLKSDLKTKEKYPYEFELYVSYIVDKNSVITKYEIVNKDNKEILFGLGGHPAFKCEYSKEEYEIIFNKEETNIEFLELENGLVSDKKASNILKDNKIELLKNTFRNDAIIMKNINSNKVVLCNKITKQEVLDFDFTGFPYLALWSKIDAPFICIEPWFNTADHINSNGIFKNKENVIKLNVGETFNAQYKVTFK